MYISFNWLKDFVKIPAKIKPEALGEALTAHTVEVESLIDQSQQFAKVVVGKVLEVSRHPNADRLRLALVDVKKEKLRIVCGAPNLAVGQSVPVALVGANLPNGLIIKESEIRGEKSRGMICAEDELGLGDDHEGILVLNKKAKTGQEFSQYLQTNDTILEIDNKSLSNRADLLNHYGLAREISAIFELPLKPYAKFLDNKIKFKEPGVNDLNIKIDAKESCLRYTAVKIDNITIQESPEWLKNRLVAIKQRPINNIVDLTNYVMFECGQPLHAFEAADLDSIVVRAAVSQESLETLDGKERLLAAGDILVTRGKEILGIAGVMGGKNSEVTAETKSIILESANFAAAVIRKTSQRLGLRSEASLRFEKSLDPNLTEIALKRFVSLLKKICPEAEISSPLFDYYPSPSEAVSLELDLDWLSNKIGQDIKKSFVTDSLSRLGFVCQEISGRIIKVDVPSWRSGKDIKIVEDLAEEVLRLYGYDKIESKLPILKMSLSEANPKRILERTIKQILVWGQSFSEVYNYSFVSEEQLHKIGIDSSAYLKLANPQSNLYNVLRQSLAIGLLGNIKTNQSKEDYLRFIEIGNVFFDTPGNQPKDNKGLEPLPYQEKRLGLVIAGGKDPMFELKGVISWLVASLFGPRVESEFASTESIPAWSGPNLAAKVKIMGEDLGLVALVNTKVAQSLGLKKATAVAEINFFKLSSLVRSTSLRFSQTPKFPAVVRDLAFVVGPELVYNDFRKEILDFDPLIVSVELFDIYQGTGLSQGEKSLAFRISYQSPEKTLTAAEIDKLQQALLNHLVEKFSVRLRDF